ncbi:MAG: hypothetical protein ACJ765_04745 [Chloroflexota bacterium]|jgi:hypothetical protein
MGFLRRLLGGESDSSASETAPATDPADAEDDERARDVALLREDHERLDDLARRQLRYAEYAWEPPAQGGERRADDSDPASERAEGG